MQTIPLKKLLSILKRQNIFVEIVEPPLFHDEPRFFCYTSYISEKNPGKYPQTASGVSLLSPQKALYKCLMESAERYCLLHVSPHLKIKRGTQKTVKDTAFDASVFRREFTKMQCDWIQGNNVINGQKILFPLQMVYLFNFPKENSLGPLTSNGAAIGTTSEQAITNAMYELIERDAFMTSYLIRAAIPRIDVTLYRNKSKIIDRAINETQANKLELYVFDITNDLQIPSFLSLIVDKTGVGPLLSAGAKTNFNWHRALEGSIEEAFLTRPWIRMHMLDSAPQKENKTTLNTHTSRGLYWAPISQLKNINYLLNQPMQGYKPSKHAKAASTSPAKELKKLQQVLTDKKCQIYTINVTHKKLKELPLCAYKVVIPQLQPLYLDEQNSMINWPRLKKVALFWNISSIRLNKEPHFFL